MPSLSGLSSISEQSNSVLDTDRITLPSLCTKDDSSANVDNDDVLSEYFSGPTIKEKVSVWDPLDGSASADFLQDAVKMRRKLHTPPEIRQRIKGIQKAKEDREMAKKSSESLTEERDLSTPLSLDHIRGTPTFSRDGGGLLSRDRVKSGALVSQSVKARLAEKKKVALDSRQRARAEHGHHAHASPYLRTDRESAEEMVQRRLTEETMKKERGVVTTTSKKPNTPPKSAAGEERQGGMEVEPLPLQGTTGSGSSEFSSEPSAPVLSLNDRLALNDSILREEYKKYFGPSAKKALHHKFLLSSKSLEKMPNDKDVPEGPLRSPRNLYLREVQKANLLPLALPVRKSKNPRGVFLGGKGLGDTRILPIVKVLDTLPAVETIDFSDNRMTDVSLVPLMAKLTSLTTLTHLDLSYCKMDVSSVSIMDYISSSNCTLKKFFLQAADIDDYEIGSLCDAMIKNHTITHLCLAKNLLGSEEHKRLFKQNLVLGGDALARLIVTNDTITSLDLSWNSLKGASAVAFGRSLRKNKTLKTLLLQFNAFGDLGTQSIGWALKYNKSITHLDLSNNSLVPRSTCVLANALSHNTTLKLLNISDNMLGRIGSQAVVAAIQRTTSGEGGQRRVISFANCDCMREDKTLFDPAKPQGQWVLDLEEPYSQMIAEELFFLANFRAGCSIDRLEYKGSVVPLERRTDGSKRFNLKDMHATAKLAAKAIIKGSFDAAATSVVKLLAMFGFTMENSTAVALVKVVGNNWVAMQKRKDRTEDLHEVLMPQVFYALFQINDEDGSASMELEEFISTLDSLGVTGCDPLTAKKLMEQQDKAGTGSIYPGEFATIMVENFCRVDQPRGKIVEKRTGKPWPIPSIGTAIFDVKYVIESAQIFDVGGEDGIETLIKGILGAKTGEQREILFDQACQSPYFFFTADQAQMLFDAARNAGISRLPLDLIICILPQIVNEEQTNAFLENNLNDLGRLALRIKMGPLYNAFVGLPTGHYFVDLSKTLDRMGAKRVAAVAVNEARVARANGTDVSQKGNGTNFRNEIMGRSFKSSVPLTISGQWFAGCPTTGELRFDYVSSKKVLVGTLPMTQRRFRELIDLLDLRSILELKPRAEQLAEEIVAAQAALAAAQEEIAAKKSKRKALERTKAVETSTTTVTAAKSSVSRTAEDGEVEEEENEEEEEEVEEEEEEGEGEEEEEEDDDLGGGMGMNDILRLRDLKEELKTVERRVYSEPCMMVLPPLAGLGVVKDQFTEIISSCHHYTDIMPQERQRDVSRMNYNPDPNFRPPTPEVLQKGPKPDRRKMPAIYPYAYRRLLELQIRMPSLYLTCDQVVELMDLFPEEGYQRIQVLLSVFSHIVDSENVCEIYEQHCSADEREEMMHRLGILCIMDPLKPEREYRLDLRRWDMREWCKILIVLAINEPGDNWVDGGEYRWSKYDDPVPGWILPAPWCTPDESSDGEGGPRRYGWLRVTYTSSAKGCEAAPQVRRNLRKRCLAGLKTTT